MSPVVKYTLGRLGIFLVVLAVLVPVPMNILLKLILAIFVSAAASYFLLARWRDQVTARMEDSMRRRRARRDRLRSALAGEDTPPDRDDRT